MSELTPMMKQYMQVKEKYQDCILMYRLGDFYEMFFEDAKTASKELSLFLTGRDCGQGKRAPMCGVPFHSASTYISRLVGNGYKVAICEQLTDPSAKGLVERGVIRVVTPGTVVEEDMLPSDENNYILCAALAADNGAYAYCDVSTGEFICGEFIGNGGLVDIISSVAPKEMLLNGSAYKTAKSSNSISRLNILTEQLKDADFELEKCKAALNSQFNEVPKSELITGCAGALVNYLHSTQFNSLTHLNKLKVNSSKNFMVIDSNTRRNLELVKTARDGEKKGTLLWLLNKTKTPMGSREIKNWMLFPLYDIKKIKQRQDAVVELMQRLSFRQSVGESISDITDIERLAARLSYGSFNAKNCAALKSVLKKLPNIKQVLGSAKSPLLYNLSSELDTMADICSLIEASISDDPNENIKEGGIIKDGYNKKIDEYRNISRNGKKLIEQLEENEREQTGIRNLKIGYNRVFGYYIDVTKSYMEKVPYRYVRKQTLANSERFVTQELSDLAEKILNAEEKLNREEYECFLEIRQQITLCMERLQMCAKQLALIDSLYSLATVGAQSGYVMPEINTDGNIEIIDGRHPVLDKILDGGFIPNDTHLDNEANTVMVITGPNMAGKSTYMRQVALLTLMAHIGSAIPAASANIALTDRIFTRVGATDDLSTGQSTFMVEMNEVAEIIDNATKDSLLILDEIGRGTSTYDGLSIAWAVLEHISDKKILGAKALFSTHYHELTELENTIGGVKNYQVTVRKMGGEIVFLYKIVPGGAMDSFGIEVARLSGLPSSVISRAQVLLEKLMNSDAARQNK